MRGPNSKGIGELIAVLLITPIVVLVGGTMWVLVFAFLQWLWEVLVL